MNILRLPNKTAPMKYISIVLLIFFSTQIKSQTTNQQSDFLVKPYLQLGKKVSPQSLQVLWHAPVSNDVWVAEYKNAGDTDWKKAENQTSSTVAVGKIAPFYVYSAAFSSLKPGTVFQYRVSKNSKVVFSSDAKSLKSAEQSYQQLLLMKFDFQLFSNQYHRHFYIQLPTHHLKQEHAIIPAVIEEKIFFQAGDMVLQENRIVDFLFVNLSVLKKIKVIR